MIGHLPAFLRAAPGVGAHRLLYGSPSEPDPFIVAPVAPAQLSAYRRAAGLTPLAVALNSALLYSCFLTNGAPVIWLSLVGGNGLPEVVRALS